MSLTETLAGQSFDDEIKVFYADDPEPDKAGARVGIRPYGFPIAGERSLPLLAHVSARAGSDGLPAGTSATQGGHRDRHTVWRQPSDSGPSLRAKVYSLDIDPKVPTRLEGRFSNVEYLIGRSAETLPPLLSRLQKEGAEVGFVLVDGDHSVEGVRTDIEMLLRYKPVTSLYIVMHDSFNPDCRAGLKAANWAGCPHVHAVELDFVPGAVNPSPSFRRELWGGLALGILKPEPRQGRFRAHRQIGIDL